MFERLTEPARKVMALANQEAARVGHEYILSLGVYGHATLLDLRAVIERLPNYPWPVVADQQREEKVA